MCRFVSQISVVSTVYKKSVVSDYTLINAVIADTNPFATLQRAHLFRVLTIARAILAEYIKVRTAGCVHIYNIRR